MGKTEMTKWERAYYLIEAKECIDNLLFIKDHVPELYNLGLQRIVQERRRLFYVNLVSVYDNSPFPYKKETKSNNPVIKAIFYERDKDSAHHDADYEAHDFQWETSIQTMKTQLAEIKYLCRKSLPDNLTIDYVPHDKELFRVLHQITPQIEQCFEMLRYTPTPIPEGVPTQTKKIVYTIHDAKLHKGDDNYGVVLKNGITMFEGVQNLQRGCVLFNILQNQNMWMTLTVSHEDPMIADYHKLITWLINVAKNPNTPEVQNGKT